MDVNKKDKEHADKILATKEAKWICPKCGLPRSNLKGHKHNQKDESIKISAS